MVNSASDTIPDQLADVTCEDTCWKWSSRFRSCRWSTVNGAGDLFAVGFVSGVKQIDSRDTTSRRVRQRCTANCHGRNSSDLGTFPR